MKIAVCTLLLSFFLAQASAQQTIKIPLNDSMFYIAPTVNGKSEGIGMVYLHEKKYFQLLFHADTLASLEKKDLLKYNKNAFQEIPVNEDTITQPRTITLFRDNNTIYTREYVSDAFRITTKKEGYLFWTMQDFGDVMEWHIIPVEPYPSFQGFSGSGVAIDRSNNQAKLKQVTKYPLKANTEYIIGVSLLKNKDLLLDNNGKSYTITVNMLEETEKKRWRNY